MGAAPEVSNLGRSVASAKLLISHGTKWERVGESIKGGQSQQENGGTSKEKMGSDPSDRNQFTNRNGYLLTIISVAC